MRIECAHCKNALNVIADFIEMGSGTCPSCGSNLPQLASTAPYHGKLSKRIVRVEVLEVVGQGQFGTVWKARDTRIERNVALKLLRQEDVEETTKTQFLREAQASAAVRRTNIVTVQDVDEISGQLCIAGEFINGVTLRQELQHGRLSFSVPAELLMSVTDGVHKAHEAGIPHRDLKPSNILMDVECSLFVSIFGLAKCIAAEIAMTVTAMILGTPAYMSPEQARGDSDAADRRSDVYSRSVILYEMITGQKPFDGTLSILLHQIQSDDPRMPRRIERTIPRDLETICQKTMVKSADKRFQTAGEFADDLRCCLAGEPVEARRSSPMERVWRKGKREPACTRVTLIALISNAVTTLPALSKSSPVPVPAPPGRPTFQITTFITSTCFRFFIMPSVRAALLPHRNVRSPGWSFR